MAFPVNYNWSTTYTTVGGTTYYPQNVKFTVGEAVVGVGLSKIGLYNFDDSVFVCITNLAIGLNPFKIKLKISTENIYKSFYYLQLKEEGEISIRIKHGESELSTIYSGNVSIYKHPEDKFFIIRKQCLKDQDYIICSHLSYEEVTKLLLK